MDRLGGRAAPALELRAASLFSIAAPLLAALDDLHPSALDDTESSCWRVFFFTSADRDCAATALAERFGASLHLTSIDVPDEDWARRAQADLRAVRVGALVIAPPWDMPSDGEAIVIEPSTGFGTGHHGSTRVCLDALQAIDLRSRTVLDVGTGSGVLAIAAARLGAARVLAIDHDADALSAAAENVDRNHVAPVVRLLQEDLESLAGMHADVVLANLTHALLARHAAALLAALGAGGILVVSGFTADQEEGVRRAYEEKATCVWRGEDGEWVGLTLVHRR